MSMKSPNMSAGEAARRGKLKATDDKPKGGNQNHKIDSAKARPARQVLEFTDADTVYLLSRYQKKMIFEREDYDPVGNYFNRLSHKRKEEMECIKKNPSDISQIRYRCVIEIEYMEKNPFDREAVLKYISQVRNSDGFDVDVCLADWLHPGLVTFIPVDMSVPSDRDLTYRLAKFVTSEINVDMKSETFEFVEVVKAVTSMIMGLMYLTLAVKNREEAATSTITIQAIVSYHRSAPWTLRQWRVKPEARAVEG